MGLTRVAMGRTLSMGEESALRSEARRARRGWILRLWAARLAFGVAILSIWQVLGTWVLDRFWVSSPLLVGSRVVDLATSGMLAIHLWATLEVALYGLALGMVAGTLLGIMLGLLPRVASILQPYIMMFYTLPRIALAPLFIMYLGIGTVSKVALTFTMIVFIALLNSYEGVRAVDPTLVDMLRTMHANRWRVIQWVVLPSIVPWLLATVRIGIGMSMIGAIVAELISASRGIGWYMLRAAGTFDVTGVFTGMVVIAFMAAILNGVFGVFERRMLEWRQA